MTIGEKIKMLRESLGLTQEELAKRVGATKQTIFKYENGIITNIPMNKITVLADALGTTPAELMGWAPETSESYLPGTLLCRQLQTELKHLLVEFDSCSESGIKELSLDLLRCLSQMFNQKREIDAATQIIPSDADAREYRLLEAVNHLRVVQSCAHKIAQDAGEFSEYLNNIIKECYYENWKDRTANSGNTIRSDNT